MLNLAPQDTFQAVRDRVAQILADNLATLTGWEGVRVYTERAAPWDMFSHDETAPPLINIYFDNDAPDKRATDSVGTTHMEGLFVVDCLAVGWSQDTATGHASADEMAARTAQTLASLARQILLAGENAYLGMRGVVSSRWVDSRKSLPPAKGEATAQRVALCRLTLGVKYIEVAPQVQGVPLEQLYIELKRGEDGRVLASALYNYATT